jgi:hypothetical protein
MIDTSTDSARHPQSTHAESAAAQALHDENVVLVHRIRQMRAAMEVATHENARLRHALAQERADNLQLRRGSAPPRAPQEHHERIRAMLSDPASRNP